MDFIIRMEEKMIKQPWKKFIILILVFAILIATAGCQSQAAKGVQNWFNGFRHAPDQIGRAITGIVGGLGNIGGALADQFKDMLGGMTGR